MLYPHHPWSNTYIFGMEALLLEPNPGVPVLYRHYPWSNIYILGVEALILERQSPGTMMPTMMPLNMNSNLKLLTYLTSLQLFIEHVIECVAITSLLQYSSELVDDNAVSFCKSCPYSWNAGNVNYLFVPYVIENKAHHVIWFKVYAFVYDTSFLSRNKVIIDGDIKTNQRVHGYPETETRF